MELLIDLPNIQIQEAFEDRSGNYILTVISTEKGTHCHKCGKRIDKSNGYGEFVELRHLDILGKQVYLRIRLPRYQCDCDGQPTTTQQVSWFTRRSGFTKAFEERILLSCVNSTIADVTIKEKVTYELVSGVVDRNIDKSVDWESIRKLVPQDENPNTVSEERVVRCKLRDLLWFFRCPCFVLRLSS